MVYNYTKPRGPIAAMYSSPGPVYHLPSLVGYQHHDPRSVHDQRPAWSFGHRYGKVRSDSGPGPCYLPDAKLFRDGKDGTPHFSIYPRLPHGKLFETPAPCAYNVDPTTNHVLKKAPSYAFGTKTAGRRYDDIPAPIKYSLDPMIGRTIRSDKKSYSGFTIAGRSKTGGFGEDLQKSPGPGAYNPTEPWKYKTKDPLYSLGARVAMPGDNTQKPGPAHYSPRKDKGDGITFGIKHSQYKGEYICEADVE